MSGNPIRLLLRFCIGLGMVWLLVRSGLLDLKAVGDAFLRYPMLGMAAFAVYVGVVAASGLRWYLLLRAADVTISPGRFVQLHMVGIFFNSLLPGGSGGDLAKGFYLFRDDAKDRRAPALASILADRVVGLYGVLTLGALMAILNYRLALDVTLRFNSIFYGTLFALFSIGVWWFMSSAFRYPTRFLKDRKGWIKSLNSLFMALQLYRQKPGILAVSLGITLLTHCGLIGIYYISAMSLQIDLPLQIHGFVVPTLTLINGLPISPAGVGVGEVAGEFLYRLLGVKRGGADILAMVHITVIGFSVCGAPFYLFGRMRAGRT